MKTFCGFVLVVERRGEGDPSQDGRPLDTGPSRELARFDAAGHAVEIHQLSPGSVMIVEHGAIGEPSSLRGLVARLSLSELYSTFAEGPIPQALVEFEQGAPDHLAGAITERDPVARFVAV